MKVLVCGGRDYNGVGIVYRTLDELDNDLREKNGRGINQIIAGGARGADSLAEMYAEQRNIPRRIFKAKWDKYGKKAGYLRNVQMLEEGMPDMAVAFPGGKGTDMMVNILQSANIPVIDMRGD
tara:strand:- start:8357 stop:8725 length:369 start_codon:yes stop_codon:yes gene_type:complete